MWESIRSRNLLAVAALIAIAQFWPIGGLFTASAGSRDRTPPTQPTNLSITGKTARSVSLTWQPSTDNSGSFFYRVRCNVGLVATVPQTQTAFTWTSNLTAGQTYSFSVYAVDSAGNNSKSSNTVTVTLPSETLPLGKPTVSVTDLGPTYISLAWTSTGGSSNLRYSVYMDDVLIMQPTADTSATFYLLDPETMYTFKVQAKDGTNSSPISDPLNVTTEATNPNDATAPTMPANLRQDHYDGDPEINLYWTQSVDDNDPQSVIRYDVYVNGVLDDIQVGTGHSLVYGVDGTNTITIVAVDTAGNESVEATITVVL
jgi:hypothetical protein